MRTIAILAGAAALGALAPAFAQAPVGTPTQPGAWGQAGWQQGGTPAAQPAPVLTPAAAPGTVQTAAVTPAPTAQPAPVPAAGAADTSPQALPDAPPGEHRLMAPGAKLPRAWRDPRYTVADWQGYGFGQPGPGMRWMRYYDDAALVDANGRVIDVHHDVAWDRRPAGPAYAYGAPAYAPPPMPVLPQPGTVRTGPHTTVTTMVTQVAPPAMAGGSYYGAPIVSATPGYVITTTTRTTTWRSVRARGASRSKLARR